MDSPSAYIPIDRRRALLQRRALPDRSDGTVLFADLSGYTAMTEAFIGAFGTKRGVERLTQHLNAIHGALIDAVAAFGGSVVGFAGDALTCWFDGDPGPRATDCAFHIQRILAAWAEIPITDGRSVSFGIKIALSSGPIRRFQVGDPAIQIIDALAGATLVGAMRGEQCAQRGEVVATAAVDRGGPGAPWAVAAWRTAEDGTAIALLEPDPNAPPASRSASAAPPEAAEVLDDERARPWLPRGVYEQLRSGHSAFLAEIRPVVALFLRFAGLDYDADEAAEAKLDALIREVQRILAAGDGNIMQLVIGDKGQYIYATFGAPAAHEDDPARALRAALDLRGLEAALPWLRDLQIGVSGGRMLVGSFGNATFRTYSAIGDEVNVAARLMMKAAPGQILANQRILEAAGDAVVATRLEPLKLKGKSRPLEVSQVEAVRHGTAERRQAAPELVGRAAELGLIAAALAQAARGSGQVVLIEGEAGVGKSQLAEAAIRAAAGLGMRCVIGACQRTDERSAYAPWGQILASLFELDERLSPEAQVEQVRRALAGLNPAWAERLPLLGDVLDLPIAETAASAAFEARVRQEALHTLLLDVLAASKNPPGAATPLLIVIEDIHWLDEASRGFALVLGRALARLPIVLLTTQRPPLPPDLAPLAGLAAEPHCRAIAVRELTPEAVNVLLAARLGGTPPLLLSAIIQARTQGNPFFVEELLEAILATNRLRRRADGSWYLSPAMHEALQAANCLDPDTDALLPNAPLGTVELGLPDSVRGVVLARIDRLPEAPRLTLKVASTIGQLFEFPVLQQVHPLRLDPAVLREHIEHLETHGFTAAESAAPGDPPAGDSYHFKHNIIQEVAYETLLEAQQRELHLAVGRSLEQFAPEAVEQLAYHFTQSGDTGAAVRYLERAARKAQQAYANETALVYYGRLLGYGERWAWRKGQLEVLHLLGRREAQRAALEALAGMPDAPAAEVAWQWGIYTQALSEYEAAEGWMREALAGYQAGADRVGASLALRHLGAIARARGDYAAAREWYATGLADFRANPPRSGDEKHALAQLLVGLGTIQRQQGAFREAEACYQEALALNQSGGNRWGEAEVLNSLGGIAYYQRQYADAQAYYERSLQIRRAIGNRAQEGISLYNVGLISQELGDYGKAREALTAALAIQQSVGNRAEEANIWNTLGTLHHQLGDLDQAQACLQTSLALSQAIGTEVGQAYALANLGGLRRDQGDLAGAERDFLTGLDLARNQDERSLVSYYLSHLAMIYLQTGAAARAGERAREALELRRELRLDLWTTADLATLAAAALALGESAQAAEYAGQALDLLARYHDAGLESPQRDYFLCSQVLAALGDRDRAATALRTAHELVQSQAAKIADPAMRQVFLTGLPLNRAIGEALLAPD